MAGGAIEGMAPILHVADARASIQWYAQLGFDVESEHVRTGQATTAGMSAIFLQQRSVAVEVQRPALRPIDAASVHRHSCLAGGYRH